MPKYKVGDSPQEAVVRAGYLALWSPTMVLKELQDKGLTAVTSTTSVKVIACRLKVSGAFGTDHWAWTRGTYVPPNRWDEYKFLLKYMTAQEASKGAGGIPWDTMRKALGEYNASIATKYVAPPRTQAEAIAAAYNWYVSAEHQ